MITKIKGTQDIIPKDIRLWQKLEEVVRRVSKLYNYTEIRTPIFEASELFHRGVGETTDIVKKETYDFLDRGGRSLTLRPEGTASIMRSVIENKLYSSMPLPLKLFYYGPMFRYERPQKGRQRQFHQFGAEAIGSDNPLVDGELIAFATTFLFALGIRDVVVKINSLGDQESKEKYHSRILEYLKPRIGELCQDCQRRHLENPLRVLDCKVDKDNPVLLEAPKPLDSLSDQAKQHFDKVIGYLKALGVNYEIDKNLVRGLDYYTHTVFEIEADLETLGAQATLCGGGRYDGLSETLGGPKLPSMGFSFGIERLLLALESFDFYPGLDRIDAYLIVLGDQARFAGAAIAESLRRGGLVIDYDYGERSIKGQFNQGEKLNPRYFLIFGEDEYASGAINVKNAKTGVQERIELQDLYRHLVNAIQSAYSGCTGNCQNCEDDC
ncbi:MAG: histidine--tRNA ligase [Candidatus Izemoplasmatales bacterium]|nr:histidine--tRNA ligase [Candidatus Izemoplasmatales bacterium]